jgi:hypothetical protein
LQLIIACSILLLLLLPLPLLLWMLLLAAAAATRAAEAVVGCCCCCRCRCCCGSCCWLLLRLLLQLLLSPLLPLLLVIALLFLVSSVVCVCWQLLKLSLPACDAHSCLQLEIGSVIFNLIARDFWRVLRPADSVDVGTPSCSLFVMPFSTFISIFC